MQEIRRLKPSTVSRRTSVVAGFYQWLGGRPAEVGSLARGCVPWSSRSSSCPGHPADRWWLRADSNAFTP
jgi:hypothetical protein